MERWFLLFISLMAFQKAQSQTCDNQGRYIVSLSENLSKVKSKLSQSAKVRPIFSDSKSIQNPKEHWYLISNIEKKSLDLLKPEKIFPDCRTQLPSFTIDKKITSKNDEIQNPLQTNDPLGKYLWGLKEINFEKTIQSLNQIQAQNPSSIRAALVGVCDTGASPTHEDLEDIYYRVSGELVNFDATIDEGTQSLSTPLDVHFHGTHVTGTIAASLNNSKGILGAAPNVKVISGRVFSAAGSGFSSSILKCIRVLSEEYKVDVINLSLGGPLDEAIDYEIQRAIDRGTLIVMAAGNSNRLVEESFMANQREVITVGALSPYPDSGPLQFVEELIPLTENYNSNPPRVDLASYSNFGRRVDITAPGSAILSTMPYNGYAFLSGTSMAAPHVAAVSAILRSINPRLSNLEIKKILYETGKTFLSRKDNARYSSMKADLALAKVLSSLHKPQSSLNNPLTGVIDSFYTNTDQTKVTISGWLFDPDQREEIELVAQIRKPESEVFFQIQNFIVLGCGANSEVSERYPSQIKNNAFSRQRRQCPFSIEIPIDNRDGNFELRLVAIDRDMEWDIQNHIVLKSNSGLSSIPISKPTFNAVSPRGQVTSLYRQFFTQIVVKGWLEDSDNSLKQTYVALFAQPEECDDCGAFQASNWFWTKTADSNGRMEFDFVIPRTDEDYFFWRHKFFVAAIDIDRNGDLTGVQSIPLVSGETVVDDRFIQSRVKMFRNQEQNCTVRVTETYGDLAVEVFSVNSFLNISNYLAITPRLSSRVYFERRVIGDELCGRNTTLRAQWLPSASGFTMTCPEKSARFETDVNDNLDLTYVRIENPDDRGAPFICKDFEKILDYDGFNRPRP